MIWLSWVAFSVTLIAVFMSARKIVLNWIVGIISNILWCIYAIGAHQTALFYCNIILGLMGLYGFQQWTKKYEK
jgi:nicotinamide riboside transporter PnuC